MGIVRLGRTNIEVDKNGFGALPIQRISMNEATKLLQKAYQSGITYFDTARMYTDSEEKIGSALADARKEIFLATKTMAVTVEGFWKDLNTSLECLKTDYIDVYQFHNPPFVPKPDDGSGLYEAMLEAKEQGKIHFIGITNHRLKVAEEAVESGLYDTLQFPFCYLASDQEIALVNSCREKNVGFVAMKALSGGLITNAGAASAFQNQFDNVLPIWGVQKEQELDEFISYMSNPPSMNGEWKALIDEDRAQLAGEFCRGCGYCLPCPAEIDIPTSARMGLMLRRAPEDSYLTPAWKEKMKRIENCIGCNHCADHCPYGLNTPDLLRRNYEDYKTFL